MERHRTSPIVAERRLIKWTQLKLAAESGLSIATVRAAEQRGATAVSRASIEKIASALGLPPAALRPPEAP